MKATIKQLVLVFTIMVGIFFIITAFEYKRETEETYNAFEPSLRLTRLTIRLFPCPLFTDIISFDCERCDNIINISFLSCVLC